MKSRLLIVILSIISSGCVPVWVHDFYRPELIASNDQSYVTKAFCYRVYDKPLRGTAMTGPQSRIVYPVAGILFSASIVDESSKELNFQIDIAAPEGSTVQMQGSTVTLADSATNETRSLTIVDNSFYKPNRRAVTEERAGRTVDYPTPGVFVVPNLQFKVNAPKPFPDEFIIEFPKLKVNGVLFGLPKIKFKRDVQAEFMIPANC